MQPEISTTASMDVHFKAEERCLRHVRLSIVSFIMVMTENRELASRVSMAAAELVENAVKYTVSDRVVFRVLARLQGDTASVRLETENEADGAQIATLRRILDEVGKGDGMETYMRFLRAVPEKPAGTSQLGLARIRYEGQMRLHADAAGNLLRVVAESEVRPTLAEVA